MGLESLSRIFNRLKDALLFSALDFIGSHFASGAGGILSGRLAELLDGGDRFDYVFRAAEKLASIPVENRTTQNHKHLYRYCVLLTRHFPEDQPATKSGERFEKARAFIADRIRECGEYPEHIPQTQSHGYRIAYEGLLRRMDFDFEAFNARLEKGRSP